MRDINRIYPLCNKLAEYWSKHPDLRFGQWMYGFFKWIEYEKRLDPVYMKDDKMFGYLKEYMKE